MSENRRTSETSVSPDRNMIRAFAISHLEESPLLREPDILHNILSFCNRATLLCFLRVDKRCHLGAAPILHQCLLDELPSSTPTQPREGSPCLVVYQLRFRRPELHTFDSLCRTTLQRCFEDHAKTHAADDSSLSEDDSDSSSSIMENTISKRIIYRNAVYRINTCLERDTMHIQALVYVQGSEFPAFLLPGLQCSIYMIPNVKELPRAPLWFPTGLVDPVTFCTYDFWKIRHSTIFVRPYKQRTVTRLQLIRGSIYTDVRFEPSRPNDRFDWLEWNQRAIDKNTGHVSDSVCVLLETLRNVFDKSAEDGSHIVLRGLELLRNRSLRALLLASGAFRLEESQAYRNQTHVRILPILLAIAGEDWKPRKYTGYKLATLLDHKSGGRVRFFEADSPYAMKREDVTTSNP